MAFHLPTLPLEEAGWVFAVLTLVILLAPLAAKKLRLPDIVGLVLAGTLIGPNVLGLVEYQGPLELLGSVGLLYLMFVAGVELDLDDFVEHRRDSIVFGAITFLVPMVIGTLAIALMGFELLAAVLLASCWASHTLVSYPEFRRFGAITNRAVTTTVGATIITDTAALVVLAVVAGASQGSLGIAFWATLLPSMVALAVFTGWLLPKATRWSFATFAQDRSIRFAYLLAAMFLTAGLAELAGIEAIVGAFLAGLAVNRSVPAGSLLMERVEFLGSGFLVPLFLVSVGMLIDPAVAATDPASLATAAGFIAVALGTKFLAAVIGGRLLGHDRNEIGAMFSLSSAQAAATLAAVIIGLQIGLIDEGTVNAVIFVILVTCLVSSWAAGRYAPRLPQPDDERDLGQTVLVPIADPRFAKQLLQLGTVIARGDAGLVVPLTVVAPHSTADELKDVKERNAAAEAEVLATGADARTVVRIDSSAHNGILHTLEEQDATCMVLGWHGRQHDRGAVFGGIIDPIVADAAVPTAIVRPTDRHYDRIVLAVSESNTTPTGRASLCLAITVVERLLDDLQLPVIVVSNTDDDETLTMVADRLGVDPLVDRRRRSIFLREVAQEKDLLIVPVKPEAAGLRGAARRIARAVPHNGLIFTLDPAGHSLRSLTVDLRDETPVPMSTS